MQTDISNAHIFLTVGLSLLFGAVFALIYRVIWSIAVISVRIPSGTVSLLKRCERARVKEYAQIFFGEHTALSFIPEEILNALFIFFFGCAYSVFVYIAFDGVIRLFSLFLILLSFFVALFALKPLSNLFIQLCSGLLGLAFLPLYYLTFFVLGICRSIKKVFRGKKCKKTTN